MKKSVLLGVSAAMCIAGSAIAGTVADNCGCGLGTMALGTEEGIISHVAATFLPASQ
ncbi:MAG: hypothetical protein O2901_00005 [Verrucomicrobia bacterium]|nr:hypothetical protein [Verrucomicrobiota bacterium]